MSIYCSSFSLGDEHKNRCARMKKLSRGMYEYDESKPCTCGNSPLKYQGSNVLPSKGDEKGGELGFAFIAHHITRKGRDNNHKRRHPYLRFHMRPGSLILTRKQCAELRDALTEWLDEASK